jgi:hypothetical protein
MIRAMTLLNEHGDTSICWTEEADAHWEAVIQRLMDQGVTFFLIDPRTFTRTELTEARTALTTRSIAIKDEDVAKLLAAVKGAVAKTPSARARSPRRARTAREASQGQTVGVRQARGG